MLRIINNSTGSGSKISAIAAGEVFNYTGSSKGNNGLCLRLKDSKAGKGRFVNLASGKVLTAGANDRATVVNATVKVVA